MALTRLRTITKYKHIFVDTPGTLENQPILEAVLRQGRRRHRADRARATRGFAAARSIQSVIAPAGVPWRVLINNWDPRDGELDLNQTRAYLAAMRFPALHRPRAAPAEAAPHPPGGCVSMTTGTAQPRC
jgi:chromosome partitioning protein